MSSRTEEVSIFTGARHREATGVDRGTVMVSVTVARGCDTVTVDGITYYATPRTWHSHSYRRPRAIMVRGTNGRLYPQHFKPCRLFTADGTLTIRHWYPAGSLEALVCEAVGREPSCSETFGTPRGPFAPVKEEEDGAS